jgi:hypothetical protein
MRGRGVPSSPRQPTPADSNGGCSSLLPDLSLRPISEPMSGPISGPYHHTATDACTPLPPPPPRRFSDGHGSHGQLLSPSSGLPPPPPMTPGSYLPSTPDAHSPLPPPPPRRLTEGHDNHGRITSPLPGPLPPPLSEPHHSTTDGRTPLPPPLPRRLSTDQESHHEGSTVLPPPPPPVVSTDPRLDFLSAQFDCVLALNTLGLLPPNPRCDRVVMRHVLQQFCETSDNAIPGQKLFQGVSSRRSLICSCLLWVCLIMSSVFLSKALLPFQEMRERLDT